MRHHQSFALISASGCELWLGVGRIKEQRLELADKRAKKSSHSFRKNVRKSGCFVQITDAGQMTDAQRRCWHTINLFIQESSSVTVKGTARKEERKAVYQLQCVPLSNVNQYHKNLVYLVVLIIFKSAVRTVIWKNFQIPVISSLSKYCSMFWTNTNPSAKQSVTLPLSALFKHALMHYCWTDILSQTRLRHDLDQEWPINTSTLLVTRPLEVNCTSIINPDIAHFQHRAQHSKSPTFPLYHLWSVSCPDK